MVLPAKSSIKKKHTLFSDTHKGQQRQSVKFDPNANHPSRPNIQAHHKGQPYHHPNVIQNNHNRPTSTVHVASSSTRSPGSSGKKKGSLVPNDTKNIFLHTENKYVSNHFVPLPNDPKTIARHTESKSVNQTAPVPNHPKSDNKSVSNHFIPLPNDPKTIFYHAVPKSVFSQIPPVPNPNHHASISHYTEPKSSHLLNNMTMTSVAPSSVKLDEKNESAVFKVENEATTIQAGEMSLHSDETETDNVECCSHFQQYSRSMIGSVSDASVMHAMCNIKSPINLLKNQLIQRIFDFLNHSDLVNCRVVQKRWKDLISEDSNFLDKTTYVVNIEKHYDIKLDTTVYHDVIRWAQVPFRNSRFQNIDYRFLKEPHLFTIRNSDNERYFPNTNFLKGLSSLEFRNSFVLWSTIKRMLANTAILERLVISNCYISEAAFGNVVSQFEEFSAGNNIFGLKALEIYETKFLDNITKVLRKLTACKNQSLTTLKLKFYPPAAYSKGDDMKSEGFDFCRELKALLSLCAKSLEVLVLDIQYGPIVDILGYHLSRELESLGKILNLREFQLSPSLGVWSNSPESVPKLNVAITMKNVSEDYAQRCMKVAATSLARFLESQYNLVKLGLPCIEYPEAYSSCFKSVLRRVPFAESLRFLAIPCAGFLPEDFLHLFPNLKRIKIGASCCGDFTSPWESLEYYDSEQLGSSTPSEMILFEISNHEFKIPKSQHLVKPSSNALVAQYCNLERMNSIEELCISTIETPLQFYHLAKNLSSLTALEVNSGFDKPVLCDSDLQACIKYMKSLKSLVISCANNFTDFGVTGIPKKYCQLMFKLQKYHFDGVNQNIWTSEKVAGRPLSDLRGLRKLVLVGDNSLLTDIGLAYGLTFQELKFCHLPYSHYITSWGIARLGEVNPSIQTLILSGVNKQTKCAFDELLKTHARLSQGDLSRSRYFFERESIFPDDFSLILPSPLEFVTTLLAFIAKQVYSILGLLRDSNSNPSITLEAKQRD